MQKDEFLKEIKRLKQISDKDILNNEADKLKDKLEDLSFQDRTNKDVDYYSLLLHKFLMEHESNKTDLEQKAETFSEILVDYRNQRHDLTVKSREVAEDLKKTEANITVAELNIRIYEDLISIAE